MPVARPIRTPRSVRLPSRQPSAAAGAPVKLGRLANHIGFAVRIAQLAVFADFNARFAPYEVTAAQFSVLSLVRDNPGVNQTALACALHTETPRMVLLVDGLERRRWVTRLVSTVDGRARSLYLTAEGAHKLKILEKVIVRHERQIARRLRSADKAAFLQMLRDLATPYREPGRRRK